MNSLSKLVTAKTIGPPMTGTIVAIEDRDYFLRYPPPKHWGEWDGPVALVKFSKPQRSMSMDEFFKSDNATLEGLIDSFRTNGYTDQQIYEMAIAPVVKDYYPLEDLEEL
jgi:hypothetical protein